jgi:hypothetical protein
MRTPWALFTRLMLIVEESSPALEAAEYARSALNATHAGVRVIGMRQQAQVRFH